MSEIVSVDEYSVSEVKEYKGTHQVLRKGNVVEKVTSKTQQKIAEKEAELEQSQNLSEKERE